MTNKLRVMIAEDHQTVREGIKLLVNSQPDMEIVGEVNDGEEVLKEVQRLSPDIVVMDISMPGMNGLKATKKLRVLYPDLKVLTLTRHTDDAYLQQLIEAGASGYVLKQSAPTELIRAIHSIVEGNSYIDPAMTNKLFGGYTGRSVLNGEKKIKLTNREEEVLRMIAWGYSNKEIAHRMNLSVKTVEAHKANAIKKLNFTSRIDIVRYAILQGWLEDN
jgi:two-component system response regulator NreC